MTFRDQMRERKRYLRFVFSWYSPKYNLGLSRRQWKLRWFRWATTPLFLHERKCPCRNCYEIERTA